MAQQKTKEKTSQKAPIRQPSMLSQERIVDSDSDGPDEPETVPDTPLSKAPASVKMVIGKQRTYTNGTKHKIAQSSSGEETANEEDDATEDEASEEESESESYSAPSRTTKRPNPPAQATPPPPRKRSKPTQPTAIAPKPFKPPHGFEKITLSASDYAAHSTEFLTGDLSRKQIWHITAPASVNIRDIKPFHIQDVRSGKPIFSKNGVDFGFLAGLHKTEKLLLPDGESVEYAQAKAPISGTYHLREIGRSKTKRDADGDQENSNVSFAASSLVPPKAPREQPVGLRMRYQPYGSLVVSKVQTTSTSPPTFRMAPELPESQLAKSAQKKARKEKKASQQAKVSSQDVDAMDLDPIPGVMVKNPESGKPTESATQMVDKVFEAATENPSQETKRKKKKEHRIAEEIPV
jgi:hypothetical protein